MVLFLVWFVKSGWDFWFLGNLVDWLLVVLEIFLLLYCFVSVLCIVGGRLNLDRLRERLGREIVEVGDCLFVMGDVDILWIWGDDGV